MRFEGCNAFAVCAIVARAPRTATRLQLCRRVPIGLETDEQETSSDGFKRVSHNAARILGGARRVM
jgi:hypothetical protein